MIDLYDVVQQCAEDSESWFPAHSNDVGFLSLAMAGEVGELANLVKKVVRGSHAEADLLPQMQEELVDVFIYLCNLAYVLDVDLIEAYRVKRATNLERFNK
jgi:NTP pyrophosphatase (non-canonical NTP hydrolase)